jgi:hypothetical protein
VVGAVSNSNVVSYIGRLSDIISHGKIWLRNIRVGERGNVVVKAICYKPEGRRLDTR